jgi:thioredoxin reductase (NADPH)
VLLEQESMGGQAGSSSLIRNYLGFPRGVSGPELASRAYQQAWLFGADLIYGSPAQDLQRRGDQLVISRGQDEPVFARAVIIATGVQYRQLEIPSVQALVGAGIFYGSAMSAAPSLAGDEVMVIGGGNSAGQAALHLAKHEANVTMVVRSTSFAESMSAYLISDIAHTHNITVQFETELVEAGGSGRLETITLRNHRTGEVKTQPAAGVFIFIGMGPHTDWLPAEIKRDAWGFIETGPTIGAANVAMPFETSMPGVFAVGDVRHGSIKRVASAVGEGSICVPQVHEYLERMGVHTP